MSVNTITQITKRHKKIQHTFFNTIQVSINYVKIQITLQSNIFYNFHGLNYHIHWDWNPIVENLGVLLYNIYDDTRNSNLYVWFFLTNMIWNFICTVDAYILVITLVMCVRRLSCQWLSVSNKTSKWNLNEWHIYRQRRIMTNSVLLVTRFKSNYEKKKLDKNCGTHTSQDNSRLF